MTGVIYSMTPKYLEKNILSAKTWFKIKRINCAANLWTLFRGQVKQIFLENNSVILYIFFNFNGMYRHLYYLQF